MEICFETRESERVVLPLGSVHANETMREMISHGRTSMLDGLRAPRGCSRVQRIISLRPMVWRVDLVNRGRNIKERKILSPEVIRRR
jgi:hypothetical protein